MNEEKYTRIKAAIKEQGKTLASTAQTMGITKGTLSKTISGDPRLSTIVRIAEALNVQVRDLIK